MISAAEYEILKARSEANLAEERRGTPGVPVPAMPAAPKSQKFGNRWCEVDGHKFQSEKEAAAYVKLKAIADQGVITDLRMQVPIVLQPEFEYCCKRYQAIRYIPDFGWVEKGEQHYADVKSKATKTAVWRVKWRMALKLYPEFVWEVWD